MTTTILAPVYIWDDETQSHVTVPALHDLDNDTYLTVSTFDDQNRYPFTGTFGPAPLLSGTTEPYDSRIVITVKGWYDHQKFWIRFGAIDGESWVSEGTDQQEVPVADTWTRLTIPCRASLSPDGLYRTTPHLFEILGESSFFLAECFLLVSFMSGGTGSTALHYNRPEPD